MTHGGVDAQLEKGRYGYVHLAVHGFTELTESCPEHISLFALHVFGNAWKLLRHPYVPLPQPRCDNVQPSTPITA